MAAREALQAEGIPTRVVSMPCVEWFNKQDAAYRESRAPRRRQGPRLVEAGLALGWKEFVGDAGRTISLEHFGASADYKRLFQEFGITAEAVAAAAKDSARQRHQLTHPSRFRGRRDPGTHHFQEI